MPNLIANNFIQPVNDLIEFFKRNTTQFLPQPLNRKGTDLANLNPGAFG